MKTAMITPERANMLHELAQVAQLVTLNEAAPILGISTRTLYGYARAGKIDAKKIAGQWRFTAAALRNFSQNIEV